MKYEYEKRTLFILEKKNSRYINRYYILPLPLLKQIRQITSLHKYFSETLDDHEYNIRYGRWNPKFILGNGYKIESVNWDFPIYIIEEGSNFVLRNENGDIVVSCMDARVSFYLAAIYTMTDRDPGKFLKLLISDLKNYQHLG